MWDFIRGIFSDGPGAKDQLQKDLFFANNEAVSKDQERRVQIRIDLENYDRTQKALRILRLSEIQEQLAFRGIGTANGGPFDVG